MGYLATLLIADVLALAAAFRLAYWLRFELKISVAPDVVPSTEFYMQIALVMTVGCVLLFSLSRLYYWNSLVGGTYEYSRTFNACSVAFMLIILATFVFQSFVVSRLWLLGSWILAVLMVGAGRFCLRRLVYALREHGHFLVRAAVVGVNAEGLAIAKELQHPWSGYEVVGLFGIGWSEPPDPPEGDPALPFLGTIKDLSAVVQRYGIKELVVSSSSLHREELFALYAQVHAIPGLELRLSSGLFELLTTGVQVRVAGVLPLIGLKKLRLSTSELLVKTLVEYVLTIAGLIILSPLLGIIALGIKLDSPGPTLYRRRVLGIRGREFDAYKFRTMHNSGEDILNGRPELVAQLRTEEKLKDDPRVTRFGRWLRKFSLDELPQLFNVLRGQMSLVGPRMISPPEAEKYGHNQFNLLTVKPGLTGLWQVSGRSDLTYKERIRLDMYYIRNYTIWLDFHILFIKTANAVLRGRGAY
jgi:exopolysaccharide biosynthesis polyprenyl glycosylphosphotransferase